MTRLERFIEYSKSVILLLLFTIIFHILFLEFFIPTKSSLDIPIPKLAYVQKIDTPQLNSYKVKKVLDKFNKMGYSKIVSYKKKFIPIWIFEANLPKGTLGVALSTIIGCPIILDVKKLQRNEKILEHVVIHEYLHCMGYPHTYNPRRVMYSSYSDLYQNDYKNYAKELVKRVR